MSQDSNQLRRYDSHDGVREADENASLVVLLLTNSSSRDLDGVSAEDLHESVHELPLFVVLVSSLLGFIILATVVGNVFVVVAITVEKNLRNAANFLIASLAVADLLVAVLVMPIAAVYEVTHKWYLGSLLCDVWTSFDVICCTASILHLVAISLDRYWVVTQIDYVCHRSAKRILIMIALSWSVAITISVPPLFGWKPPLADPSKTGKCLISQDLGYTVFSTLGAFYLPLISMMIIYYKVYATAKSRIRKKAFRKKKKPGEEASLKFRLRDLRRSANKELDARSDTSSPVIRGQKSSESMLMVTSLTAVGYAATETTTVAVAAVAAAAAKRRVVGRSDDSECEVVPVPDSASSNRNFNLSVEGAKDQSEVHGCDPEQKSRRPATTRRDLERHVLSVNGESNKSHGSLYLKSSRAPRKHLKHLVSLPPPQGNLDSVESNDDTNRSCVNYFKSQMSIESTCTMSGIDSPQSSSISRKLPPRNLPLAGIGKTSSKNNLTREQRNKVKIEQKRERKAARTLAIVTGTFIICWLPFFIVATVRPFCNEPRCRYPTLVTSIIGWLGYINSLLNPVIYTIFNPDFRAAFHKILFKRCFKCRKF